MSMLIATYGSLKRGFHNHNRCGEQIYVGDMAVTGVMTLVARSYPILVLHDEGDTHDVEVFKVDDITFQQINNMELGAGYHAINIATPYGEAVMWVYDLINQYGMPIEKYTHEVISEARKAYNEEI